MPANLTSPSPDLLPAGQKPAHPIRPELPARLLQRFLPPCPLPRARSQSIESFSPPLWDRDNEQYSLRSPSPSPSLRQPVPKSSAPASHKREFPLRIARAKFS